MTDRKQKKGWCDKCFVGGGQHRYGCPTLQPSKRNPSIYDDWGQLMEGHVRRALSESDPEIADVLRRHPDSVLSSDSERARKLNWTRGRWSKVLVLTEDGIGDPFQYKHVYDAFNRAAVRLRALTGDEWAWESVNPAVHYFYLVDTKRNPASPMEAGGWKTAREKLRSSAATQPKKNPGWFSWLGTSQSAREAAIAKYKEFHRYDPKKIGEFRRGFDLPVTMACCGDAKWVTYRSTKVDPATLVRPTKPVDYIHEHDAGVKLYLPNDEETHEEFGDFEETTVPRKHRDVEYLIKLGELLGYMFEQPGGDQIEAEAWAPWPELYCTPDGTCLWMVDHKKVVLAASWGGALGVFGRGIDG